MNHGSLVELKGSLIDKQGPKEENNKGRRAFVNLTLFACAASKTKQIST